MILDSFKSVRDNIFEKIRNPFGGTFIVVWVFHNWRLVYSLFNFDIGNTLLNKTIFIEDYIKTAGINNLIFGPICWTFLAIIGYLFLNILSQIIFTSYQKWARPFVYWLIDRNSIVERISYETLKDNFRELTKEKEQAANELAKTFQEKKDLEKQNELLNREKAEISPIISALGKDKEQTRIQLNEQKVLIETLTDELKEVTDTKEDINAIFTGIWKNEFKFPDGRTGEEEFYVTQNKYVIVGNTIKFNLTNIHIDKENRIIMFKKEGVGEDKRSTNDKLFFVNSGKLVGFETGDIEITYTKVGDNN